MIMDHPSRNDSSSTTYHFSHLITSANATTNATNDAYATDDADATDDVDDTTTGTTVENYDEC